MGCRHTYMRCFVYSIAKGALSSSLPRQHWIFEVVFGLRHVGRDMLRSTELRAMKRCSLECISSQEWVDWVAE